MAFNKWLPSTMDITDYNNSLIPLKTQTEDGFISSVLFKDSWLDYPSLIYKRRIYLSQFYHEVKKR